MNRNGYTAPSREMLDLLAELLGTKVKKETAKPAAPAGQFVPYKTREEAQQAFLAAACACTQAGTALLSFPYKFDGHLCHGMPGLVSDSECYEFPASFKPDGTPVFASDTKPENKNLARALRCGAEIVPRGKYELTSDGELVSFSMAELDAFVSACGKVDRV